MKNYRRVRLLTKLSPHREDSHDGHANSQTEECESRVKCRSTVEATAGNNPGEKEADHTEVEQNATTDTVEDSEEKCNLGRLTIVSAVSTNTNGNTNGSGQGVSSSHAENLDLGFDVGVSNNLSERKAFEELMEHEGNEERAPVALNLETEVKTNEDTVDENVSLEDHGIHD
mmetsp:Transcript_11538/g.22696  ORF Transcript_11538/g.22696 Transcript_11538/m.22696 type:complete len:172 (+) Transcript_11538:53-568(+)